jgi:precorrin-2 methylase
VNTSTVAGVNSFRVLQVSADLPFFIKDTVFLAVVPIRATRKFRGTRIEIETAQADSNTR